jgi:hypothetical protein
LVSCSARANASIVAAEGLTDLLEADVPIDTDAGELGHLLPPQAGRAPPPTHRQADRLRRQLLPPRPQKVAEFALPRIRS